MGRQSPYGAISPRDGGVPWTQAVPFPFGTVLPDFLLPNGHDLLQPFDGVTARFVAAIPVRGRYGDHNADFGQADAADPVADGAPRARPFLAELGADLPQFGQGHRNVSFVFQVHRAASFGPFPGRAGKSERCAMCGSDDFTGDFLDGNRLFGNDVKLALPRGFVIVRGVSPPDTGGIKATSSRSVMTAFPAAYSWLTATNEASINVEAAG